MYKKIYVEITNNCNLKCDFCTLNKRENKFLTFDLFKLLLNRIGDKTKYLYFHVLGEPLLHPNINEFIDYASNNYYINLTTNGYLIGRIKDNKNIRQINISLHSYKDSYNLTLEEYMNNIFETVDILKKSTYISYRIWTNNPFTKDIIDMINKKYKKNIDYNNIKDQFKLDDNIFISTHEEFNWPSLENEIISHKGTCYALKDHIGILVDGTVIPCCLDGDGIINLGNIYKDTLDNIINSKRYQDMLTGFKNNLKCEELCKRCNFLK